MRTIAAAKALNVPRVAELVREQRRRHREVLRICKVEPSQVRLLAKKLGVRLPLTTERVPGAPPDVALRNACHVLGTAMSTLFRGEGTYAYPVKVAGFGITAITFFMSDGSVIKVSEVYKPGRRPKDYGGVSVRARAIPLYEFGHELAMTRAARRKFKDLSSVLRVPRVPRVVVLKGPTGARIGVMQQSRAPGVTVASFLKDASQPRGLRMAAAEAHGRALGTLHAAGWVHGDLHTENALIQPVKGSPPRFVYTVIDWARANTRRRLMAHAPSEEAGRSLWTKFVRYEAAFPYSDMATHGPGRAFADAYLRAYMKASGAAKGKGPVGEGLVDPEAIRRDFHGLVKNNQNAMFRGLDLVAPHTARGEKRKRR